jgi:hypothetical protein
LIFIANISESVYEKKVVSKINLEKGTLNVKKQKLDPSEVFEVKTTETKIHASEDNISDLVDFRIKQMREKEETLVMSYKGKIDVEAMDSVITLSSGEGSMVKKNDKPITPVKLLEAPLINEPEMSESFNYSNIEIVWNENKDAEHYRIEISNDPEFKKVIKIYNNHKDNEIYDTFIEGEYYIRICAIDKYAFEGYWSRPIMFRIANGEVDEKPPFTEISLVDGNPTFISGGIFISGDKYIQLKGDDDTSGIRKILYCINDGEERIYKEPFRLPVGSNKLQYYSVDRSGKTEEPITIIVNVDINEPKTRIKTYCQK